MRSCVHGEGDFVDFVAMGNRLMSVLVTPRSRVAISVAAGSRDDASDDRVSGFGGLSDYDL